MEKLKNLMENKEVVKKVMGAGSPKEAYQVLTDNGLECGYDEFIQFAEASLIAYEKQKAGLLTEEDMDNLLDSAQSEEMVGTTIFLFFIICKS